MAFLKESAEYLWQRYGEGIDKICIVLPNRRGGLYLKKYLSACAGKTLWAPGILSIEDMIEELLGYQIPDNFSLLFDLYAVYKEVDGSDARPFDEFSHWGQTVLQDFNDTDNDLADADQLYRYLNEARAMRIWNPDGRPLTDFQQRYLAFYGSLLSYYHGLRARLQGRGHAYAGMAFRHVAENMDQIFAATEMSYFFAGFNALTAAQEKVIRYLLDTGRAEIFWDADEYYLDNPVMEAGNFLRNYRKEW